MFLKGCIILCLCLGVQHCCAQTLSVISNQKGAPARLKFSELKSIMMGEKQRWGNGKKILIALMKTNTPTGKTTCEKIYDMSQDEVQKFWLALIFQGKVAAPATFNTTSELQSYIADNPGAIGIVDQPANTNDTQTILIDGKKVF